MTKDHIGVMNLGSCETHKQSLSQSVHRLLAVEAEFVEAWDDPGEASGLKQGLQWPVPDGQVVSGPAHLVNVESDVGFQLQHLGIGQTVPLSRHHCPQGVES